MSGPRGACSYTWEYDDGSRISIRKTVRHDPGARLLFSRTDLPSPEAAGMPGGSIEAHVCKRCGVIYVEDPEGGG